MDRGGYADVVVSSIQEQVLVVDADGEVVFTNRALQEAVGETASDLEGRMCHDVFHDGDAACDRRECLCPHETVFQTGEAASFVQEYTRNGDRRFVEVTATPVRDDEGDVVQMVEVRKDVTDQRNSEWEIELIRTLLDHAHDELFVIDVETGAFRFVNDTACDRLGYSRADLLELSVWDVETLIDDLESWRSHVEETVGDGPATVSGTHVRADGSTYPVEITAECVSTGGATYRVAIARDVTARRERDRQLQVFGRVARHNVRNSVNVVAGMAADIRSTAPEETAWKASHIEREADTLLSLAEKQHALSQFLTGPASETTLDLGRVLDDVVSRARVRHPDAEIRARTDGDLRIRAVPDLHRAFDELVENAVVHTDAAAPTVEVTARRDDACVRTRVVDEGPVIPAQEVDVLTVFRDEDVGPLFHGSGLGLWLVNWVVDCCDGRIHVDASEAGGNVVTLTFPAPRSS